MIINQFFKKEIHVYGQERCIERGEPINPDEKFTSYTDTIMDFRVNGVFADRDKANGRHFHSEEVVLATTEPVQDVYLVVVIYISGDTFTTRKGQGHIEKATTDRDKAVSIKNQIQSDDYGDGYNVWEGYFSGLQDVRVEPYKVRFFDE